VEKLRRGKKSYITLYRRRTTLGERKVYLPSDEERRLDHVSRNAPDTAGLEIYENNKKKGKEKIDISTSTRETSDYAT